MKNKTNQTKLIASYFAASFGLLQINAYYAKGDFEEAAKLGHKGAQEKINKKDN
tara:strand:+ start:550 stop:711 length:162 start_codon:yes stop_codon:yes gene_type:complete